MAGAPKPPDEEVRLAALRALEILDTEPEPLFDRLTELAARLVGVPIALLSFADAERHWFKSRVGLAVSETPREQAFGSWTILGTEPLVVPDATEDPRFADNPLVLEEPKIRFYAGVPLLTKEGALGTLCVIDRKPRTLTEAEREVLEDLANVAAEALELRRQSVTSRRRARLLSAAEALAAVGHWRLDVKNRALFWSDQVYRIHGLDPANHTPDLDHAIDAYHPDDRARVANVVQRAIDEREGFELTARLLRSDGSVRWVRSIGVPEIVNGSVVAVFGVFQDFTERHELRERLLEAEKLASIGTLAAGMAHEVNNPLNYIKLNARTLAEHIDAWMESSPSSHLRELSELVAEIRDGATRIERIVGGLRVFARRSPERLETVDLERVFMRGERLCGNELRHRARFRLDVEVPARVHADETQLVQVAVNLLINAAHAIEEGDREANEVRVVIGRQGDRAFFEVRDTGTGMSEEVQRKALTPFFTTKEPGVGTGLGLAVCHGIVTSLGGTLSLQSIPGKGTTVRVELPAVEAPEPRAPSEHPSPAAEQQLRLLIIDDDPLVARSISRIFREHEVEVHPNGQSALAALREGLAPDVILCDLMMPTMSGAKFYEALRELDPRLADRLIVVTGGAFSEQSRTFVASGVPVVFKPIDVDALRVTVGEVAQRAAETPAQ